MRKNRMCILCAALMLVLFACSSPSDPVTGTGASSGGDAGVQPVAAEDFADYADYGLVYQETKKQLLFDGERVRYFEDLYPIGSGEQAGMTFFDEAGTVDVKAERDLTNPTRREDGSYDPSGVLLKVRACTQEEFDARDVEPLRHPSTNTATSGDPPTPQEMAEHFAAYEPYGLSYDRTTDILTYNGKTVRYFLDVMSSNGESLDSGKFQGTISNHWTDSGVIDVIAKRNYGKDGSGVLTGISLCTQAEFDERTKSEQEKTSDGFVTFYGKNETTEETGVQHEN